MPLQETNQRQDMNEINVFYSSYTATSLNDWDFAHIWAASVYLEVVAPVEKRNNVFNKPIVKVIAISPSLMFKSV